MIAFADASALVKRYVPESGARDLEQFSALFVSGLTRVEVASAVARGRREAVLSEEQSATLLAVVDADFEDASEGRGVLASIPVREPILQMAADLLGRHSLRAGDAVQLASALAAREVDSRCETFVCFDKRLRSAAARERFQLVPA